MGAPRAVRAMPWAGNAVGVSAGAVGFSEATVMRVAGEAGMEEAERGAVCSVEATAVDPEGTVAAAVAAGEVGTVAGPRAGVDKEAWMAAATAASAEETVGQAKAASTGAKMVAVAVASRAEERLVEG